MKHTGWLLTVAAAVWCATALQPAAWAAGFSTVAPMPNMPNGIWYYPATLLQNGKVLIAGGDDGGPFWRTGVELYDPVANSWSTVASLNTAREKHTATLLPSGKVLVAGGEGNNSGLTSAELYDPAANIWNPVASLNTARVDHTATLLKNGKVLIAGGGSNSAELYDPEANTWSAAGTMAAGHADHTATLLPNGKVLVAGGGNNVAELYDPVTNTWSTVPNLSIARSYHTATLLQNGKVLVVGGFDSNFNLLGSAEMYNSVANTWTTVGSLITARAEHAATLLENGKVLVAGGEGNRSSLSSAELYDPATNAWAATGSMANTRFFLTATLLPSGKVFVVGDSSSAELYDPSWDAAASMTVGYWYYAATLLQNGKVLFAGGDDGGPFWRTGVELYDPVVNTWSTVASLNTARENHTATLLPSGKVLVAGGEGNNGGLTSTELYDPVANIWTPVANLITVHVNHTATLLKNGKVLVSGGGNSSAEQYDPVANTWSAAGSMTTARANNTATLLPSGKVLAAGGFSGGFLSTAELYNPVTNSWQAVASLAAARENHTATLLPNGKVLVVGGEGNNGYLSSVELYDPVANAWLAAGSLVTARSYHTATLLPGGKVLIAGGDNRSGALKSAELYDPATNTWSAAGSMAYARFFSTATLLSNGKVLVAGDYSSAELYDPAALQTALLDHFEVLNFPSPIAAGTAGGFTVQAVDENGGLMPGYTGQVMFFSSDKSAKVPAPYTFTAYDYGAHAFTGTLSTPGYQSLCVLETGIGGHSGWQTDIDVLKISSALTTTGKTTAKFLYTLKALGAPNLAFTATPLNFSNFSDFGLTYDPVLNTISSGLTFPTQPGSLLVQITVGNEGGSISNILRINIKGAGAKPAIAADAAASPNPVQAGVPVNFTANYTGTALLGYLWNFGDGTYAAGTNDTPSLARHAYAAAGTYKVAFSASDGTTTFNRTLLMDVASYADMEILTAALSLNFATPNSDTLTVTGLAPVTGGDSWSTKTPSLSVGTVTVPFPALGSAVSVVSGSSSFKLLNVSGGSFPATASYVKFQATLGKQALTDAIRGVSTPALPAGVIAAPGVNVQIPITIAGLKASSSLANPVLVYTATATKGTGKK